MHVIIIPYRDRAEHLQTLLPALQPHFANVNALFMVVEQVDHKPFNRGKLFNCGVDLLKSQADAIHGPVTLVLHDVDLVPEQADYHGITGPTHLSKHCTQFTHGAPRDCFGGVVAMPLEDFRRVNGFNNDYWGWGAEDDDLRDRCRHHGLRINWREGRYRSLPHQTAQSKHDFYRTYQPNLDRLHANRTPATCEYASNGLNSLQYDLVKTEHIPSSNGAPRYIHLLVSL